MADGIIWCPHCGKPHALRDRFCGQTGLPLEQRLHRLGSASSLGRAPAPHPLIGKIIDRKYRITRHLGGGGNGQVFAAENLVLNLQVAIKVVSARRTDALVRLRREAMMIAAVQHPNICVVHDIGTMPDGSPYVVLERLFGDTLRQRLRAERGLSARTAADWFGQLLAGLHAAHLQRILHRDLTPQNVFIVHRLGGVHLVKLVDFGFAKDMSLTRGNPITEPGHACGSPHYMSPEQMRVEKLDARSDLFAVGVLLFESLTGQHPFAAAYAIETQRRILEEPAPPLRSVRPSLSRSLEAVVARALAKDREDCFSTALSFRSALEAAVEEERTRESTAPRSSGPVRRIRQSSSPSPR